MRLLVVGATGRTGQQVREQALKRGHRVTALVRSPSLPETEHLRVVVANPYDAEELLPIVAGHDAVISCLGPRPGGNPWIVRDAAVATLRVLREVEVKRYLVVSGALLYPSRNPFAALVKRMMAPKLADARAMEGAVSAADVDWTVVRPPYLRKGDVGRGYRIETGACPDLTWSLHFRDLADCLLDLAEGESYFREVVGVASA